MVCGIEGCRHRVERRGECGARRCPLNARRVLTAARADTVSRLRAEAEAADYALDVAWPAPTTVTLEWRATTDRHIPVRERGPFLYDASVPGEIAGVTPLVSSALAGEAEAAALAVLDLNRDHDLDLESVALPLLRSESLSSSRIEGLDISHRQLAVALHEPGAARERAREVAQNVDAMAAAISRPASEVLTANELLDIHRRLLAGTALDHLGGELRTMPSWIGVSDNSPLDADYVPPPPEEVERLVDDLVRFVNRDDIQPVIQAAVAHAQFEAVHPFVDGNGRVGRALVHIVLRRRGVAERVVPPVSAVLLRDRDRYFDGLAEYQQHGLPEVWCGRFASAVTESTGLARRLGAAIGDLRRQWLDRAGQPRKGSVTRRLITVLPSMAVLDASSLATRLDVDGNVARRALNSLEDAGVLLPVTTGKRNRVWIAEEITTLLDSVDAELRPT